MGWRNSNIFAWSPQDVATFLDEIGLSGLKSAALVKSITGPQLISMSPEEMSEQLGATALQARKIHSELNGLGPSNDLGNAAGFGGTTATGNGTAADQQAAQEAAAYNTAGTTGAFIDPKNPNQSLEEYYNSNQSLSGFQIGGAAVTGGAVTPAAAGALLYSPMGTALAYPPPESPTSTTISQQGQVNQQQSPNGSYQSGRPGEVVAIPLVSAHPNQEPKTQQQQLVPQNSHLRLCRSFFIGWLILLIPLLLVAMGDLGLSIFMNGKFSDNKNSPFSEWGYIKSEGVLSPHYLDADMFWCILFFVAQGYTILISLILIALLATIGRSGSLNGTRNLAFATLLLSFLGLTLYTMPIVKWTYVIATDYAFSTAFNNDAIIPAVAFGLEWLAVLLWLVCLILAAIQLGLLGRKKYKTVSSV